MYCTRCGTQNPDGSANCFNCGHNMDGSAPRRVVTTGSAAAAPQKAPAPSNKVSRVDVAGTPLEVSEQSISFGSQHMRSDDVIRIRYGVYKHYINGIRDSQSYAVWLTDQRSIISIECAKGLFIKSSTIEARYQEVLKALYPIVIVPLVQSFLINLDKGDGFQVGDVTFDKSGLHRSTSLGAIQKGLLSAWVSVAGGRSVEEREQRHQHLAWSNSAAIPLRRPDPFI